MDGVFTTILFVLPGILMMSVSDNFRKASSKKKTDYEKTLFGIAWSVPILLSVWALYLWLINSKVGLEAFIGELSPRYHSIWYLGAAALISVLYGFIYGKWFSGLVETIVNLLRGNNAYVYAESTWEMFTGNRKEALVRIFSLSNPDSYYLGTLKSWSTSTEAENGVLLKNTEEMHTLNQYLHYPLRTYYNTATNTVYEYFSLEQLKEAFEKKKAEKRDV